MSKLYVLGGRQRRAGIKEPTAADEWCLYDAALILEVDTLSGAARVCVQYQSPEEARAGQRPSAHFHSGARTGDILYTCTTTEVLTYRLPHFERIGYVSLPIFNDLHHVTPTRDGNLLLANTGLDMVVKISPSGAVIAEWSAIGEEPWARFSRSTDYRKVATTKPHLSHPNFVFELDDDVWVTRFHQRDAACMTNPGKSMPLASENPHDGLVNGDHVLFTAVNGKVITVNRKTLRVEKSFDLREIQDRNGEVLPAWCRGLLPVDQDRIWVGFTRIRQTIFKENVRWVKSSLREGTLVKPTHIALFDMATKECLKEIDLEPFGMHTVFGIFPA